MGPAVPVVAIGFLHADRVNESELELLREAGADSDVPGAGCAVRRPGGLRTAHTGAFRGS
jgi:hypothetical protein